MSQKTAGEIGEDKKQELEQTLKPSNTRPGLREIRMTMMMVLTNRESPVEHLVLEDVCEGGGVPGEQVGVPRRRQLPR